MKIYTTVKHAIDLVIDTLEHNNKHIPYECIYERVQNWYNNTDVTDPEILAGCALFCDFYKDVTYADMLYMKEWWFPTEEEENYSEYLNTLHTHIIYS